jgi:hypothetical protein
MALALFSSRSSNRTNASCTVRTLHRRSLSLEMLDERIQLSSTLGDGSIGSFLSALKTSAHVTRTTDSASVGLERVILASPTTTRAARLTCPAAPAFTATPVSATQINLSWTSVAGASRYVVEGFDNGVWTRVGDLGRGSTGETISGLIPGTTYNFRVGAFNAKRTTWANGVSVTTFQSNDFANNPTALVAYSPVSGSLFGANGPSYLDVQEGDVGDCWLLAALAEVAARAPSAIENMFTYDGTAVENGSSVGIYTVRFFNYAGTAEYVTVDTELPAGGTFYDAPANAVLWVALAEKAYAAANGAGFVTTSYLGSDSYAALNGGDPAWALQAVTGKSASDFDINPCKIASAYNEGQLVLLCTGNPVSSHIVSDHCYAVVGYNASSAKRFEVYNPWGTTASGMVEGDPCVYGLFYARGTFVSRNFDAQPIGTGAAAGLPNKEGHSDLIPGRSALPMVTALLETRSCVGGMWNHALNCGQRG